MSIENAQEFENTRNKLRLLEERLATLKKQPEDDSKAREWTIRSLGKLIKQLKEELIRYEVAAKK
jgi:hypothetical protein